MSKKFILILIILVIAAAGLFFYKFVFVSQKFSEEREEEISGKDRFTPHHFWEKSGAEFRNSAIKFVRKAAENYFSGKSTEYPEELEVKGDWQIQIIVYSQGVIKGNGSGEDEKLSLALEKAVKNTLNPPVRVREKYYSELTKEELKDARFLVKVLNPLSQPFSFIEYKGEGKELVGTSVAVRELDKNLIIQKIQQGKEYLLKMIDKKEGGAHKYYYALSDFFENRLHTIYTSSLVYTLLNLYEFQKDTLILEQIFKSAEFVLSMQNKEEGTKGYGAFYYSYYLSSSRQGVEDLDSQGREKKFVVGTTSKTIFTLLRLYNLTGDSELRTFFSEKVRGKYLESAKLGADWLLTMQNPDGSMKSYIRYDEGKEKWVYSTKESLLYNGQVLSALSKIYLVTEEKKYYDTAEKIAKRFVQKYEEAGRKYIKGEYRSKNPISNSWLVMSFIDFYKASGNDYYKEIIFEMSDLILKNQHENPDDLSRYGQWKGAYSTSGNGWISEVMTEVYWFCREQSRDDCDKYKESIVRVIRWLIQNTYSEENSFMLKNPERAIGGIFWNEKNKYIRTDSVSHGLNSYIGIIDDLEDGLLISIPDIVEEF